VTTNPYRLSPDVRPVAYRLHLEPNLESATFAGTVEIDLDLATASSAITLHAIELDVEPAELVAGSATFVSSSPTFDATYETATFTFASEIPAGRSTMLLRFTGILNDQLHGFYRSTFTDDAGVEHVIATTQFEATDARRAFPCFDEPSLKATYQTTLVIPEHLEAYSNTAVIADVATGDGRRSVTFAETMIMSTYLVAFVVGPFEATAVTMVRGVPVRIVYPVGKGHLCAWAMEAAVHALEFFTDYFAIAYPGDKVDLVAIPDFAAGAMENLGCVTFRETELLIDPATASTAELERVALVINHELAHMWFGDLVTMGWWEGIWLNEAFATFMESICTDHFRPEWKKWVGFNPSRDMAFTVDGQHSTRPIEYEVISPNDCRGMFDILTYVKGCSILRMLEQFLGEETFRDGIRIYLKRHAYANTVTADLWAALEEASSLPVGQIMDTWIYQGGYPLISVEDGVLTQQPFAYAESTGTSAIGSIWQVPVLIRSLDDDATETVVVSGENATYATSGAAIINAGGSGFYRTRYSSAQLATIAARLTELDELERAVLLSDTWASVLVGQSSFEDVLTLALGLADLDEPATWTVVATALRMANRIVVDADRPALAAATQRICGPVLARLGVAPITGESHQAAELRAIVLDLLGVLAEDPAVISYATQRFDASDVSGDLADAIVGVVMNLGRPGDLATCEARRQAASNPQDEQRWLFAGARSADADGVLALVDRCFTDVRTQDAPYLLAALIRNRLVGVDVWRAATARWAVANAKFPHGSTVAVAAGVTTIVESAEVAQEVRAFHEANPVEAGQRQVEQFLDLLDLHVSLAARTRGVLGEQLAAIATRA